MRTTSSAPPEENGFAAPVVAAPATRENENSLSDAPRPCKPRRTEPHSSAPAGLHLVLGPVGAGKSTFALALARDVAAVRFNLDQWMTELFSPDRPAEGRVAWYVERAARCLERIWAVANDVVRCGMNVVLEIGLLSRRERELFYDRVDGAGLSLTVYVLDASRDVRRERVMKRNEAKDGTFCMVVPPEFFELASDLWEPFVPGESDGRDVRFFDTDPP